MFVSSLDGYSEWYSACEIITDNVMPYSSDFEHKEEYRNLIFSNGKWKFKKVFGDKFPENVKEDIFAWDEVDLPHRILDDTYNENEYPWHKYENCIPPYAPKQFNQIACYIKDFEIDDNVGKKFLLIFEGVAGAFYLYVNSQRVGFYKNSFSRAEFDISEFVTVGKNNICVEVHAFSTASWLECDDAWNLAGIFRNVFLYSCAEEFIADFTINSFTDEFDVGTLEIYSVVAGNTDDRIVELTVLDENNNVVAMDNGYVKTNGKCNLKATIPQVKKWSHESPNLYTLKFILKCNSGIEDEVVSKIGFRNIEVSAGKLYINGKSVKINGVNIKEFDSKLLDEKKLEEEIIFMKLANINAIKVWRHPFSGFLYKLCDKYGIYVIDECNMDAMRTQSSSNEETYLPGSKGEWTALCKDRVSSMYQQHKNYSCIIAWSIGNVSGGGNVILMREYLEENDNSRFIFSEYDKGVVPLSERVILSMADADDYSYLERYLNSNLSRAVLLTEISKCIGNSCGGLSEYRYLLRTHKNFIGGFLSFWNSIKNSDALLKEVSQQFSSIDFIDIHACNGIFDVVNDNVFTNLSKFTICWKAITAEKKVGQGFVVIPAESESVVRIELPVPGDIDTEWFLTLSALSVEKNLYAPKATVVSSRQFVINKGKVDKFKRNKGTPPILTQRYSCIGVECEDFEVCFSNKTGLLTSFVYQGKQLLKGLVLPTFWRTPTEVDVLHNNDIKSGMWQNVNNRLRGRISNVYFSEIENKVVIDTMITLPTYPESEMSITYTIYSESIDVQADFEVDRKLPPMTEFGIKFELNPDFTGFEYFGMGPEENYEDRNSAAHIGLYSEDISQQKCPYSKFQEYANHCEVRYAELSSENCIMRFEGETPVHVSAIHNNTGNPFTSSTIVKINSWQLGVNEKVEEIRTEKYKLKFSIMPLYSEQ